MTHLVELVCTLGDGSTRFETGDKLLKTFEVLCIRFLNSVTEDDDKPGLLLAENLALISARLVRSEWCLTKLSTSGHIHVLFHIAHLENRPVYIS